MIKVLRSDNVEKVDQVLKLEDYVRSVAGAVKGSDFSRLRVGGNLFAQTMCFGPHSIFLTLNFSDVNDLRCYQTAESMAVEISIALPSHKRPDNATRIRAATGNPVGSSPSETNFYKRAHALNIRTLVCTQAQPTGSTNPSWII